MSKNTNGGLDHYEAERFGKLTFATIRKSVGLKGFCRTRQHYHRQVTVKQTLTIYSGLFPCVYVCVWSDGTVLLSGRHTQ